MKLFCSFCNENHDLSTREVERVVYAIQGQLSDVIRDDNREFSGMNDLTCLKDHLAQSFDADGYGEWVAQQVESRRVIDGVLGCKECGEDMDTEFGCISCEMECK